MSDPYANTVTVRNILNHILAPKIVNDGNGGYTTKIDLVGVDHIVFNTGSGDGTSVNKYTGQCGFSFTNTGTPSTTTLLYHKHVTANSVIFVTSNDSGLTISRVSVADTFFEVHHDAGAARRFSWFIARF